MRQSQIRRVKEKTKEKEGKTKEEVSQMERKRRLTGRRW